MTDHHLNCYQFAEASAEAATSLTMQPEIAAISWLRTHMHGIKRFLLPLQLESGRGMMQSSKP